MAVPLLLITLFRTNAVTRPVENLTLHLRQTALKCKQWIPPPHPSASRRTPHIHSRKCRQYKQHPPIPPDRRETPSTLDVLVTPPTSLLPQRTLTSLLVLLHTPPLTSGAETKHSVLERGTPSRLSTRKASLPPCLLSTGLAETLIPKTPWPTTLVSRADKIPLERWSYIPRVA